jgi:hypothetical protein
MKKRKKYGNLRATLAPPDDPIYRTGLVFGGGRLSELKRREQAEKKKGPDDER